MNSVVLVNVGSDSAVYVGNNNILAADPTCGDSTEAVSSVAHSLAHLFGAELVVIDEEPPCDDWDWVDVGTVLLEKGVLQDSLSKQHVAVKCAHADLLGALQCHEQNDWHSHDWGAHQQSIDELEAAFPHCFEN